MGSELIFDIGSIDFGGVSMDREALMRWLPHRGVMQLLDAVVWHDAGFDHAIALKRVRPDEFWCDGHIPGYPLMPGVLMIEAGAQLASVMFYRRSSMTGFAGFTRIEETAFRGQVLPGDDLYILCKCLRYNPKRFVSRLQGLVRGEVVFESTITGMAFPKVLPGRSMVAGDEQDEPARVSRV